MTRQRERLAQTLRQSARLFGKSRSRRDDGAYDDLAHGRYAEQLAGTDRSGSAPTGLRAKPATQARRNHQSHRRPSIGHRNPGREGIFMLRSVLAAMRRNAVASVALTVAVLALAGGAYAALRLPAGSVTNRAIANHTITPGKLNVTAAHSFGGYIRDWASVNSAGQVTASNRNAFNAAGNGPQAPTYSIGWFATRHLNDRIGRCVPEVTVQGSTAFSAPGGFATAVPQANTIDVHTYNASGAATPEPFYLVVIC
jgi:hypothetical protein